MTVLVSGVAGSVGSHVARQLVAGGDDVVGIVLKDESLSRIEDFADRIELHECDLQDFGAVERAVAETHPLSAVHLAWYTAPGKYWNAKENLDCVAQGMNLARVLAEHGCKRIVAAGTCAEYDWSYERLHESDTPCRPRTLYGAAKHALYLVLDRFCRLESVEFAWARYNFIYGPGESPGRLVPSVIRKLKAGEDVACTHGRQRRDFLHVEDVASATVAVLKSGVQGAVNIGSGEPATVRKVVETLARLIGGKGRPLFGELAGDPEEPELLVPDVGRLQNEVRWHPRWSLEDGLRATVERWRGDVVEPQTAPSASHGRRPCESS